MIQGEPGSARQGEKENELAEIRELQHGTTIWDAVRTKEFVSSGKQMATHLPYHAEKDGPFSRLRLGT